MKRNMKRRRGGWFLWIGGACFLAGSLVAGSYGLASSATNGPTVSGTVTSNQGTPGSSSWPVSASQSGTWQQEITDGTNVLGTSDHPVRTDPTGSTTQPVSGTVGLGAGSSNIGSVGISGSLPAGTNDIGTVQVAAPTPIIGQVDCQVPDTEESCDPNITGTELATGSIVNTVSVFCSVLHGSQVIVNFEEGGGFLFTVPLTFEDTDTINNVDLYTGTLTNLGIPIQSDTENFINVSEDYEALSGNGADCGLNWTGTTS